MRKTQFVAALSLLAACTFLSGQTKKASVPTVDVQDLPQPTDYLNDYAHVLSPKAVAHLDRICSQLDHSQSDTQVAVVTLETIGGEDVAEFAKKLFNKWGIGRKETNRGVLVLLSINDHKWRIAVGYGLEGTLTNSVAADIGRQMVPLLKSNDFDGAVTLALQRIAQVVSPSAQKAP
jgi:uncharacterized protein